jgi:hypothetical protein
MNAPRFDFLNARRAVLVARLLAAAGAGALLSGCVTAAFDEAKVDPASPVAGEVARLARANADFPDFKEIPATPTDIRPLRAFGQAADRLKVARTELEQATAPQTWSLQNSEAFAGEARRRTPDLPPPQAQDSEAFARELRERATPPPPR